MNKHLRISLIAATLAVIGLYGFGSEDYASDEDYGYGMDSPSLYEGDAYGTPDSAAPDGYAGQNGYPGTGTRTNAPLPVGAGALPPVGQSGAPFHAPGAPMPEGFVRHTEPSEQAFSVAIPASWRMQTQIDRSTGYGARTWKTLASPDGQVVLRSPDMPPVNFVLPTPGMGMHEGMQMGPAQVRSYARGGAYAREHAQRVAQAIGCGSVQPAAPRDRADLDARQRQFMPAGAEQLIRRFSTGEAEAHCRRGGQPMTLIVHATTVELHSGAWYTTTSSTVAPAARADEARRAMEQFALSFTPNMQWANREAQVGLQRLAAEGRARSRSGGRGGSYAGGYGGSAGSTWSGSGSSDAGHDAFINSIHGTTDLTDQFGDTVWGVESNSQYHWQDQSGNIIGTDIDENPNPLEYTRMNPRGGN